VDFKNTVLIMTSNVGSQHIAAEKVEEKAREQIEEALTETFPPEFLNRIDDVVIFHRLSKQDLARIVDIQVAQLSERVRRERGLDLELTDKARELLGNLGFDPTYGARPLKRVVQKQLVDKLALKLLEGEFTEGDTVAVDVSKGELSFKKATAAKRKADRPEKAKAAA
jgi:ATP-dependent Clp protease ATP-binding subunit ClpB